MSLSYLIYVLKESQQSMKYQYNSNVKELLDTTRFVGNHLIFFSKDTNEVIILILKLKINL